MARLQPRTPEQGAYVAERAAALSGVPLSTVHYWARNEIVVPSLSPEKVKLWSYADLFRLRLVYWLRQPKLKGDGREIPPTTMPKIRRAFNELARQGLDVWDSEREDRLLVNLDGHIYLRPQDGLLMDGNTEGQTAIEDVLDLMAPFAVVGTSKGPDLIRPRPTLRIEPGKLSGSPHIADTRLETVAVAALRARDFTVEDLRHLYPFTSTTAIDQAIDLEVQLNQNLLVAA